MDQDAHETTVPQAAGLTWKDGVPVSTLYDDIYYSDGLRESRHVFFRNNDLARRFRAPGNTDVFNICELGFGTGLNFLLARRLFLRLAPPGRRLIYVAMEKFPMTPVDMERALAPFAPAGLKPDLLVKSMPMPVAGFHRLAIADERVVLLLYLGDAEQGLKNLSLPAEAQGRIHAWFLDGFAPARNPEMWTRDIFEHMARHSAPDATAATFTAAAVVRNGLAQVGFSVKKVRGFGRKRDMLRGVMSARAVRTQAGIRRGDGRDLRAPWYARERIKRSHESRDALVIGAGLAGSSAAYALARRGYKVTVLEKGAQSAAGASGVAAGIILPVLSARPSHFSRYSALAYLHLLRRLESLEEQGRLWDKPGLLQLHTDSANRERLSKALTNLQLPDDFVQSVDRARASELAGMELAHGGLFFPEGAWVETSALCRANLAHPHIHLRTNASVGRIRRQRYCWQALDATGNSIGEASVLILATALDSTLFAPWLPQVAVRGQLFTLPSGTTSRQLQKIVCYDGYMLPDRDGHVIGATFELDNQDPRPQPELNRGLLHTMLRNIPGMREAFTSTSRDASALDAYAQNLPARVAFRAATRDRFPIIGPLPAYDEFIGAYEDIAVRSHRTRESYGEDYPPAPLEPDLYVSTGHGSRGLIYTCLGGEYLASLITGEASPLPRDIAEALHPARFLVRKLKTGPIRER